MFPRRLILLLSLSCSLLAGAQPMGSKFVFTPQATAQAQFAGYYVALEKGYYEEEGLDVLIAQTYAALNGKYEGAEAAVTVVAEAVGEHVRGAVARVVIPHSPRDSAFGGIPARLRRGFAKAIKEPALKLVWRGFFATFCGE